jgi:general stress protein 26
MAKQDSLDRVWDVIERVGVCMFTTRSAAGMRARPLEARPDRGSGVIWFVTDLRSAKEHEIARDPAVGLVFVDADAKAYLSITAEAAIRHDHAKTAEIWKRTDNVWWRGPDDPNVCVLRVTPLTAELWDGPSSKAVAAFEFLKARITGEPPNLGENRKVMVRMRSQAGNHKARSGPRRPRRQAQG